MEITFKIKSLQPGFLVAFISRECDGTSIRIKEWDEMKEKGFYGGIILDDRMELESLSDAELALHGLMRIPE